MLLKKTFKKCESFSSLLTNIEVSLEKKEVDLMKKHVAFRPIDNLNSSVNDYKPCNKDEKMFLCINSPT